MTKDEEFAKTDYAPKLKWLKDDNDDIYDPDYSDMLRVAIPTPVKDGNAVITPAFNMKNAKFIIHAVGPDFRQTPNAFLELFNAYYNSLVLLKDNNLRLRISRISGCKKELGQCRQRECLSCGT